MLLLCAAALAAQAQTAAIHACAVLRARSAGSDTARIQAALNLCDPGQAVVLAAKGGNAGFTSGPLILPRAVTLFVSRGVTLYAAPGASRPLIFAYQAAFSGVEGEGTIDGRSPAPELVSSYESQGFHLSGVTLRNAAQTAAAIYKTIGFRSTGLKIDSPAGNAAGMLLSNAVDADIEGAQIRVAGDSIALRSSILGPTSNVRIRGAHFSGGRGIVKGKGDEGDVRDVSVEPDAAPARVAYAIDLATIEHPGKRRRLAVSPGESIQKALDALPADGGEIALRPGVYREVVSIRKPHVHLHGENGDASKTVIVFNHGPNYGGTFASATFYVEAPDATLDHLTIANDLGAGKGQAVALAVTADRAVFRNVRIVGAQDTLFAASRYCYGDYGPCAPARQYFEDSYIEGNVDFIFGDALAVFERCHLHGIAPGNVMYTAQSRHTAEQSESAYVFDHCLFTAEPRTEGTVSLGRPWRPYATVVLLDARIEAPVIPAGWTEWLRFGRPSLPTAYYAEFDSSGPGANPAAREPHSHQLTTQEAARWFPGRVLAGGDGWNPHGRK